MMYASARRCIVLSCNVLYVHTKKLKVIGLDSVYRALPKHIQIGIIKTILVMFKLNILLNSDFRKWIIDLELKTYTPSVSLPVV